MPQMILRIAVALVTFFVGLTASTLFGAVFGSSSKANLYMHAPRESGKRRPCPNSFRSMSELPPPPVVVAPAVPDVPPPPPPAPKPVIKKRVTVKLPDGTVRVIESSVETVERKF